MVSIPDWKATIEKVRFNPHAIQRAALNALDLATQGTLVLSDASNPLIFLMESSAVNASAIMEQNEVLNRKQYPAMALTEDEIYLHMSDSDYIGRFAIPSKARFLLVFDKDEVYSKAVETGVGRIRKLTIPAGTEIRFGEISFTLQYPIDIRIMSHGGLQIVYDTTSQSPLETLASNLVDWQTGVFEGKERLILTVPLQQLKVQSEIMKITLSTAPSYTYRFKDQYCHARVYRSRGNGRWEELYTTHTDQVFDPTKLTAVLKVKNDQLTVSIPQIYITAGLIESEIRVDILTTRGTLNIDLEGYGSENFTIDWQDQSGSPVGSEYYAPLTNLNEFWTYAIDTTAGGVNGLGFERLRQRVIQNAAGRPNEPITNVHLSTRLEDLGYSTVKNIDNITNREFLATRLLPRPENLSVISGAGCAIKSVISTMSDLAQYRTVADNGNRVTLLPDTLYQDVNGIVSVVADSVVDELLSLPPDIRARRVNENSYMFSPFHYVLDMNSDRFDHRGYYLNDPKVNAIRFVDENDTAGISVGTDRVEISRILEGYRLLIRTRSSDVWKALPTDKTLCQISFRPKGEKDLAYLDGTFIGLTDTNEQVWEFILGTNYDLDAEDYLSLVTFQMYSDEPRVHSVNLQADFEIFYIATDIAPVGFENSGMDLKIGRRNLPSSAIALNQETVNITLGTALTGLWTASRSIPSSEDYQKYLADVPALYTETIFARDPQTGAIIIEMDGNGDLQYTVLHAKGDPVLDQNNNPTVEHYAGDVMHDVNGNPIVVSTRKLKRMVDLLFVDGAYWFATEKSAVEYQAGIPKTIVSWLINDISQVSQYLLEQTNLFFYPKSTLGHIQAIVLEDEEVSIPAQQSFAVTFYMSAPAYRDTALRKALSDTALRIIDECLQSHIVTANEITRRLTETVGNDAIAVAVTGLGGATPYDSISLVDDSARLSIKKIARALEDNKIGVEDDVAIAFIQHLG